MDKDTTYYESLTARYLSGEASPAETSELAAWLRADEDHLKAFREYRRLWSLHEALHVEENTDLDAEWKALSSRIGISEKPVGRTMSRPARRYAFGAAAIALLLIIPSITYFLFFMQPAEDTLAAGRHMTESILPDGTQVALNAGSTLHYPGRFRGKERKVSLEGEAYFEVTHDRDRAFVIDAADMQIRVLGTAFYVNTHSGEHTMEVVLLSGSVELAYSGRTMLLEPGEKAVVLKQHGEIVRQQHSDPNLLAWKTRKLQFDNTPLGQIVEKLESVYHKEIVVLNPGIENCRITATFDGESLEAVLRVLQSTIDITARPNGDTIELSGAGCQ